MIYAPRRLCAPTGFGLAERRSAGCRSHRPTARPGQQLASRCMSASKGPKHRTERPNLGRKADVCRVAPLYKSHAKCGEMWSSPGARREIRRKINQQQQCLRFVLEAANLGAFGVRRPPVPINGRPSLHRVRDPRERAARSERRMRVRCYFEVTSAAAGSVRETECPGGPSGHAARYVRRRRD